MSKYEDIKAKHGAAPAYARRSDFQTVFGYAKGVCIGTFPDGASAQKAGAVTTEKNVDEVAFKAADGAYRAHGQAIFDEWYAVMRAECPFNDDVWNAIYSMAYDVGHSAGYGEVEIYIDTYTEFAAKVIAGANKGK